VARSKYRTRTLAHTLFLLRRNSGWGLVK